MYLACDRVAPCIFTKTSRLNDTQWVCEDPSRCLPPRPVDNRQEEDCVAEATIALVTSMPMTPFAGNLEHLRVVFVVSEDKTPVADTKWKAVYGELKKNTSKRPGPDCYKGNMVPSVFTDNGTLSSWVELIGRGKDCNRDNIVWVGALLNSADLVQFKQIGLFLPMKLRSFCNLLFCLNSDPHFHTRVSERGYVLCCDQE